MVERVAIFLDENLNEIGTKKFESTDEFITYKKGTFNIRLDAFLYRNVGTVYYVYIYPTDEKLLLDVQLEPVTKEDLSNKDIDVKDKKKYSARIVKIQEKWEHGDLKLIVGESIIGQLARMAVLGLKQNWILIILVGVVCGLAGGGIAYSLGLNNGINQGIAQAQGIYNATLTANPTPVTIR